MKWSLPDLALRRPVTVTMIVVTVLGLGVIAGYRIPLEFIPKMDMPFIGCFIPYPGSTPEQVEKEIAIPAEEQFRTISNLKRISTNSSTEGCFVRMELEWEADMGLATSEVRDRMERLKLELPRDVERLMLRRFSSNSIPILAFTLYREGDEEELAHRVRTLVKPRLMRIDGVAEVTVFGRPEREVIIEFDQDALRSHGLGLYQVVSRLQASSLNVSVGEMLEGRTKYYLRVLGEFRRPEEMAELVVGPNGLRLKNVARVGFKPRERDEEFTVDRKGSVFVLVVKESEANTIATCDAVKAELERIEQEPDFLGLRHFMFMDQSDVIRSALDGLLGSGKGGALLAVIVLFLFLKRLLPTLVVALAIPASLMCAFVYMFFAGMSLNIVTMASMIIAVGMLVDNAIVVTENIYRHRQLGRDPLESARIGAREVSLAITASTLTTIVVFIPMFYLQSGEMAIYMRQFAAPVTVSLLASLLMALTAIPLALRHMHRPRLWSAVAASTPGRALARLVDRRAARVLVGARVFRGFLAVYEACLRWTLRSRAAAVLLIIAIGVLSYYVPFQKVGVQQMPTVDTRQINIEVRLDPNFDMESARAIFENLQDVIDSQRDVLGIKNIFARFDPDGGDMNIYLLQPEDLPPGVPFPYSTEEVMDILWRQLPNRLPGVELRFAVAEAGDGGGAGGGSVELLVRGDDAERVREYAERFRLFLAGIPNLSDIETGTERAKEEMRVRIDEDLAEEVGVSPMIVARSVDFALRGIRLPYMKQGGREIPVWAQFREEDRKKRSNLENVTVQARNGELVPLNRLVTLERAKSPQSVERVNGKNVVAIEAKVAGDDFAAVKAAIEERIRAFDLPPGYSVDLGDELAELDLNQANFITSLLLSIVLIYIVMGALFESYVLPLSILTAVPLAFFGVYWMMFITQTSMDTIAFIGCILMVGIVVNNGIIIIDHINQLRLQGFSRDEAILQGGHDRLRPVMMTALTTILGCVPLAIGGDVGEEVSFTSLGRALIGGMTTGTFLTLLVVPLFYTFIDDLRIWFLRFLRDVRDAFGIRGSTFDVTEDEAR